MPSELQEERRELIQHVIYCYIHIQSELIRWRFYTYGKRYSSIHIYIHIGGISRTQSADHPLVPQSPGNEWVNKQDDGGLRHGHLRWGDLLHLGALPSPLLFIRASSARSATSRRAQTSPLSQFHPEVMEIRSNLVAVKRTWFWRRLGGIWFYGIYSVYVWVKSSSKTSLVHTSGIYQMELPLLDAIDTACLECPTIHSYIFPPPLIGVPDGESSLVPGGSVQA